MDPKSKEERETLTSDGIYELDSWVPVPNDGLQGAGTVDSLDPSFSVTYGDLGVGTPDMFEEKLREKYPALQDAWDHYQTIKQMCETREKEEDNA
jgi:hypothetical protein|tara:strand:+ start:230 stop:514 length:285 start_codon:yes stop_codon:yes gene_type:complete